MAEEMVNEVPEIDELLERLLLLTLEEGRTRLDEQGMLTPFTALAVAENMFIEDAVKEDGETDTEECRNIARHTVSGARGARAYSFCYDGYVETDDGVLDVVIAEGGLPGEGEGVVVGHIYTLDEDGKPVWEETPAYIGECLNYMINLRDPEEYGDEVIDEKYQIEEVI